MSSQRLKAAQTALTTESAPSCARPTTGRRFANVSVQEQLCAKMEALDRSRMPRSVAHEVRELQQQWRQAADVPRAQADALVAPVQDRARRSLGRVRGALRRRGTGAGGEPGEKDRALRARRGAVRLDRLDSDRRRDQEAAGRVEDHRPGVARTRKGDLGSVPRRLRPVLHPPPRGSGAAQGLVDREPREEGCALRAGRGAGRIDRLGSGGARDQAAAGRVENDRSGQEEQVRRDLAALPRRLRPFLRALR